MLLILNPHAPRVQPEPPTPEQVGASAQTPPLVEEPPKPVDPPWHGSADQVAAAAQFAKAGQPVKLVDPERPHVSHLVGSDLADPDVWRHTEFVDGEPFSDAEFAKAEDAFLSALHAGGLPIITDACSDGA